MRKVTDLLPTEAILISSEADLKVLEEFEKAGVLWPSGQKATQWRHFPMSYCFVSYNEDGEKGLFWLHAKDCEELGKTIYPASDFIPTESEKVEVGEIDKLIQEVSNGFNGQRVFSDLMSVGNIKNEDGMSVIEYLDKPNGGSVAYVRYDAIVSKLNSLVKQLKTRNTPNQ